MHTKTKIQGDLLALHAKRSFEITFVFASRLTMSASSSSSSSSSTAVATSSEAAADVNKLDANQLQQIVLSRRNELDGIEKEILDLQTEMDDHKCVARFVRRRHTGACVFDFFLSLSDCTSAHVDASSSS